MWFDVGALRLHHRCKDMAMNSGPRARRISAGAPRSCAIRSRTSTVPLVVIRLAALPASASDELLGHVQDLDRHFPDDRAEARLASACSADRLARQAISDPP